MQATGSCGSRMAPDFAGNARNSSRAAIWLELQFEHRHTNGNTAKVRRILRGSAIGSRLWLAAILRTLSLRLVERQLATSLCRTRYPRLGMAPLLMPNQLSRVQRHFAAAGKGPHKDVR